ncbi:lactonase family protein [Trinickia acidisoli]|uniref:lactonase family protein n=1 Tax=Trinickia acidisoli TaxID=2767482 RepID=UPI001F5C50AE|nr:lactonase family protein [Trinickia acidisoli]
MTSFYKKNTRTRWGMKVAPLLLALSSAMYSAPDHAAAPPGDDTSQTEFAYVGTRASQIRALRLDVATGKVTVIGSVEQRMKPTWVSADPSLPVLYAVDEERDQDGSVTAYAVDRATGALTRINSVASGGSGTTYLSFDAASKTLLAANYGSGSVSSISVKADGSLGALVSTMKETGSGPNVHRQASAHAHCAVVDPSGGFALVPDLGADRVFVYGFDRATHALSPDAATNPRAFVAPPGSGPRHLAFGANGRFVYLDTELSAELMVLKWNASQGQLTLVQSLPISSEGFKGPKSGAEIAVSRDGRFVYVEDRGENAVAVYRIDRESGKVSLIQRIAAGGENPWGFGIDRSGKWMLVDNEKSGDVHVLGIDTKTGRLSDTGQSIEIPEPISVAFVK